MISKFLLTVALAILISATFAQIDNDTEFDTEVILVDRPAVKLTFEAEEKFKLAFGSCYGLFGAESSIFKAIADEQAHLWAWLGDLAYTDFGESFSTEVDDEFRIESLNKTISDPDYQRMIKDGTYITGVWDDHDYGANDGGRDFDNKYFMRDLYLDVIGEPDDTPRRLQTEAGIFQDYLITVNQKSSGTSYVVHMILLDNRFDSDGGLDVKMTGGDAYGETQYRWLDNALLKGKEAGAQVVVVGTGSQFLPIRSMIEGIGMYGRQRVMELLGKNEISNVILLTGDVHFAQFYQQICYEGAGTPMHEVTASGMTHSWGTTAVPGGLDQIRFYATNNWDASEMWVHKNYGVLEMVQETDGSVTTHVIIHDETGEQVALEKRIREADNQFDASRLKHIKMCKYKHFYQLSTIEFFYSLQLLIEQKALVTLFWGYLLDILIYVGGVVAFSVVYFFYTAGEKVGKKE